jgi:cytochrome P450
VLKDSDTFSSRANAEVSKYFGRSILEMDGKEHTRTRALVTPVFHARGLDAMAPTIESLFHALIDGFERDGRADLVTQLTTVFPVQVIATIIGVPRADYAKFMAWSLDLIAFSKDPARGRAASNTIREYVLPFVRARRAEPRDDVISKLVTGTVDGERLSDEEVVNFLRLLLPAGAETTSRLMGSMLFALLVEGERFERVRADRTLVPWAIEETLRWETPVLFVARETTRRTTVSGVEIPASHAVAAVVGSANRDETHYDDPDRFDLDRRADDHLPDAPAPRITGLAFRSPQSLPVRFD